MIASTTVLWPGGLNTSWYLDLNSIARRSTWAHAFMHAWALWAGLVVLASLAGGAVVAARLGQEPTRALAVPVLTAVSAAVALGLNQAVSHAAAELRPYVVHPHVLVLVSRANDYSFTSDHAAAAGALACGLLLSDWRFGAPAAVLALFLGFARVYVGAHYPGDVVAGLLLGAVVSVVLVLALRAVVRTALERLAGSPLRPLVASRSQAA